MTSTTEVAPSMTKECSVPDAQKPDFDQRLADFGSTTFTKLRPGQKLVLDEYAGNHLATPDLAIEMPTGEGKTLIALLIADWALEQGRSVAYLTGTRQLAERVEQEADLLGLDVVRFSAKNYGGAKLDDYHQAQKPGVMNYWVYFNSNPVPPARRPGPPGRRAPGRAAAQRSADAAHPEQAGQRPQAVREHLRPGAGPHRRRLPRAACDARGGGGAWDSSGAAVLRGLGRGRQGRPGRDHRLAVRHRRRDQVRLADRPGQPDALRRPDRAVGRGDPPVPPADPARPGLRRGQAAHLPVGHPRVDGRPAAAHRRWPGHPLVPATPLPAGATGDRQLILNATGKPALHDDVLEWALEQVVAADGRAAWLCASNAEAELLEEKLVEEGERVFRLRAGDDDQVAAWIAAGEGQLVTAGRYDGLDLPGDVCKW
jgi:hypothetical protein